ncbi:hypothetical protein BDZ45DRAFT_741554 [Acephala macrosclerotiorum]|nr:hypothetical protein BDZ45DRAFT_741554 [Acephala macrosclerotiorum]
MASLPHYKTINLPLAIQAKQLAEANNMSLLMFSGDYDIKYLIPDPEEVFTESTEYFKEIRSLLTEVNVPSYEEHLLDCSKISSDILVGGEVEIHDVNPMYQEIKDNLTAKNTHDYPVHMVETKKCVGPNTLVSKLFHTILNIHPLLDGNSQTSRLLMDAVLLKHLDIVIPIGRHEIEAAMFREVTARAMENEFADEEHQCLTSHLLPL